MPRTVLLRDWLDRHLARSHTEEELKDGYSLEPASADASFRRYLRIRGATGTLVIMDHVATAGAPTTSGNDLHRIDPMVVKAAATTAGFALDEESPLLANPADDHTKNVFDKSIQGKTDQFLLRYKKP